MAKSNLKLMLLAGIVAILILSFIGTNKHPLDWSIDIVIACVFAFMVDVIKNMIWPSTSERGTIPTGEQKTVLARLIMPNNSEIKITDDIDNKIIGREDFKYSVPKNDLRFIGREHFRILNINNEHYIEHIDPINGTKLNDREIKGLGKQKLNKGDEIFIAEVAKIKYIDTHDDQYK